MSSYEKWRAKQSDADKVGNCGYIEWKEDENGDLVAAAVLRVIVASKEVNDVYLGDLLEKFGKETLRAQSLHAVADTYLCEAWLVVTVEDFSQFWLYRLTDMIGWWHPTEAGYKKWLRKLREGR